MTIGEIYSVMRRTLVQFHDGHVTQVAVELVVVQAESHHEAVGNLEAAVVHRNLHDTARVAIQKGAYRKRVGRPAGECLLQVAQSKPGVHDVLHQEHVFALDGLVQVLGDAHHSG